MKRLLLGLIFLSFSTNALEILENIEDPSKILIQGVLEHSEVTELIELLDGYTTVVFHSPGGSLMAGLFLGDEIRERGMNTLIESGSTCSSACAYAFMGGVVRTIEPNATYGLHRPYLDPDLFKEGEQTPAELIMMWNDGIETAIYIIQYLLYMGMNPDLATGHLYQTDMLFIESENLLQYNVTTQ
jgi:hypothetical protein